jgi:hypothetical protein
MEEEEDDFYAPDEHEYAPEPEESAQPPQTHGASDGQADVHMKAEEELEEGEEEEVDEDEEDEEEEEDSDSVGRPPSISGERTDAHGHQGH